MKQDEHLATPALCLASATLLLALVSACSSPGASTVGSTQSALSGTVDATAATDCATTYVSCVRGGATTCRADLVMCVASGTTASADASTSASATAAIDGGASSHGTHSGGRCNKDGSISAAGLEACFSALETCAASTATAQSCVTDAVTCVTAIGSSTSTTTETDAGADASATPASTLN